MKIRPPRNPNFAELGPGRPEISRQASNPSTPALPTSPAPRNGWRASRRRPEAERLVAHLQVILSSPSRAPSEWQNGRLAQCPPRRRLQLGRVGEGRPSIQEGARIKRHGKLIDASSPAPMMRSCKVSQSSHFARPGRGESSSRDGALSPASVRSKPAWSTDWRQMVFFYVCGLYSCLLSIPPCPLILRIVVVAVTPIKRTSAPRLPFSPNGWLKKIIVRADIDIALPFWLWLKSIL